MKHILVTGGAGYIGSILSRNLLGHGYKVSVIDNLLFGGESITDLMNHENFQLWIGDIRDHSLTDKVIRDVDTVIHLASIVGDPACAKNPELAHEVNHEATKALYNISSKYGVKRFVYASTCSNYGKMKDPDSSVDEQNALNPVSLYAETKVKSELFLLDQDRDHTCKPVCLRFATVYGLSSRMRFDLTVNEFTKELSLGRKLIVYGEQFWRPYCHVSDIANAVILTIQAPDSKVAFEVFNVGNSNENYTKKMLVDEISELIPDAEIEYVHKDEDPRDYKVNFNKIRTTLEFDTKMDVKAGIRQVMEAVQKGLIKNPDSEDYRNS